MWVFLPAKCGSFIIVIRPCNILILQCNRPIFAVKLFHVMSNFISPVLQFGWPQPWTWANLHLTDNVSAFVPHLVLDHFQEQPDSSENTCNDNCNYWTSHLCIWINAWHLNESFKRIEAFSIVKIDNHIKISCIGFCIVNWLMKHASW